MAITFEHIQGDNSYAYWIITCTDGSLDLSRYAYRFSKAVTPVEKQLKENKNSKDFHYIVEDQHTAVQEHFQANNLHAQRDPDTGASDMRVHGVERHRVSPTFLKLALVMSCVY